MQLKIRVINWEKYQYRKSDSKRHSWFRFENQFFGNHKTADMTGDEIKVYLFCLCEASKEISEEFVLSPNLTCRILNINEKTLSKLLISIEGLGLIEHSRVPRKTHECTTENPLHNITEHNRTYMSSGDDPQNTLLEIWDKHKGTLPGIRAMTKKRATMARARWAEHPSQEYWESVAARIAATRFCLGENKDGWRANFDWFLKPDVHIWVLEGKYDNNKISSRTEPLVIIRDESNRIGVKK